LQAVVKTAPGHGHVALVDKAIPALGPGEVLLAVSAAGVCGTDLHIEEGTYRSHPPVTMGHEISGVVSDVGSAEDSGWLNRRVACETFSSTCGRCPWCRDGRPNLCPDRRSIGSGADGGFARYAVVGVSQLHELPAHITDYAGALCEPLACVCQSVCDPNVVGVGDDVAIIGPGTMGLLAAEVARASGGRVTLVGIEQDKDRLLAARNLGFATALASEVAAAAALGDGHGPHVVIECSGSAAGMASALNIVRRGGRCVQIGQRGDPVLVPMALVSFKELTITGGFASTPQSWRRAMQLLERNLIDLEPLISEVSSLREWETVFMQLRRSEGIKYLLDPRR